MIFTILTIAILFLAALAYYIFYLGPRMDPLNRAQEFIKGKRYHDAIIEYKKILDGKPYDFVTQYRLADLFLRINEIDQAAIHLEKIIEINKYNYEVDKLDVQKKLAQIAVMRGDHEETFKYYYNILKMYPADHDALVNVAFIALGQEEFDIAQRYFDRLVKNNESNFEIMFGAGICSYQNQKLNEAVDYFKYAVAAKPESDIANLAMILSLIKKRDYRNASGYAVKLSSLSDDIQIKFIAQRAAAILDILLKKPDSGVKKFEDLLELTKKNDMQEETLIVLYDLGFACIKAESTKRAYEYWNELSSMKRGYLDIQELVMGLRREMESTGTDIRADSISDKADDWVHSPFPADFLWGVCTLKSEEKFPLRDYVVTTKVSSEGDADYAEMGYSRDLLDRFINTDPENFRIIANRLVGKIGYKVDQIMPTYRESDGIDFLATKKDTKEKTFVWVRRWKKTKVGEIPMRNFAQMVNDQKASIGLFVTTSELTTEAQGTIANLSKIKVILPEDLNKYLQGLI